MSENREAGRVYPEDALGSIVASAEAFRNWGRWGEDDVLGALNFIDASKRVEAASLVRTGETFSLSQPFDENGPQTGWKRRNNPVHTMTTSGLDAEFGDQGLLHGLGVSDDYIVMPLQCSTQWDGLGHVFDRNKGWNGRRASEVVTSEGDQFTGIETAIDRMVTRGVLLDVGRAIGVDGELPDGFAITEEHLLETIRVQGASSEVGRGDIVIVRTGQYARVVREGWGGYAGGAAPGLSFSTAKWMYETEIAGIATDTWGFEVRPNEFESAFQPLHQVVIPNIGLYVGEMWAPDALAASCAADGQYDFMLVAAPIPVTGAVGSPLNPIAVK